MAEIYARWQQTPQQRGRPSCPCGFVGGTRNIRQHRLKCPTWARMTTQMMIQHMEEEVQQVAADQGWNNTTLLELAQRFIQREGKRAEFVQFLKQIAHDENMEAADAHSD